MLEVCNFYILFYKAYNQESQRDFGILGNVLRLWDSYS